MEETLFVEDDCVMSDDEEYALYLRTAFRAFDSWCNNQPVGSIIVRTRCGRPDGLMFMTTDGPRWFGDATIITWLGENDYKTLEPEHNVANQSASILIHPTDSGGVLFKMRWL